MPQYQIRCPHCQKAVKATVNSLQPVAQLACPHCGGSIKFRIPQTSSSPTDPVRPKPTTPKVPDDDFADFLSMGNAATGAPNTGNRFTGTYQSPGNPYTQKKAYNRKSNSIVLITAVCALGLAALVGVGSWLFFSSKSNGLSNDSAQSTTSALSPPDGDRKVAGNGNAPQVRMPSLKVPSPNLSRPETMEAVGKELESLREQTDLSVSAITDSERHTIGADRLKEFTPKFDALFFRAVQSKPTSRTMTDMVESDAKLRAEIDRLRQSGASNQPGPNYVWTLNSTNDPENRWGAAAYEVSLAKHRSDVVLQSRVSFPDPLKETSGAYEWSPEDRRVLSAYWLQGELEREVATELMACLRDKANVQQFQDRCFEAIEKHYKPALELSSISSKQGTFLIDEPKGSPYARHALATRRTLTELKEVFADEEITWIIDHTIKFSNAIENLQFNQKGGLNEYVSKSVQDHYNALLAYREKERLEELAKEEKIKQEKARIEARIEEQRIAKAEAQERDRQRRAKEAEARAAEQNDTSESDNAIAGRSRPGRPPFGMGRGSRGADASDQSTGRNPGADQPVGGSRGEGQSPGLAQGVGPENGAESNTPRGFGPPSGFGPPPGFGPPSGFGEPGPTGPPPGPPKMGTSVTIRIKGQGNLKIDNYLKKLKAALKTGNYQSSSSGSEATLVLEFGGDLEDVVKAIDFGEAEISNRQNREVSVTVN